MSGRDEKDLKNDGKTAKIDKTTIFILIVFYYIFVVIFLLGGVWRFLSGA